MRLRTTAAVFAGALALVLPTAGPSLAADDGDSALGTLHYRFVDERGSERIGQLRPTGNDFCYVLTRTSRDEPALEVRNETPSLAVLFANRSCNGEAEKVLRPGERAQGIEVVSVFFQPADEDGQGRDDEGRDDEGREDHGHDDQGREDQGHDDQGREDHHGPDQGRGGWWGLDDRGGEDILDVVFHAID